MPREGDVIEQKAAEIRMILRAAYIENIGGSMKDHWPVCPSIFQPHLLATWSRSFEQHPHRRPTWNPVAGHKWMIPKQHSGVLPTRHLRAYIQDRYRQSSGSCCRAVDLALRKSLCRKQDHLAITRQRIPLRRSEKCLRSGSRPPLARRF